MGLGEPSEPPGFGEKHPRNPMRMDLDEHSTSILQSNVEGLVDVPPGNGSRGRHGASQLVANGLPHIDSHQMSCSLRMWAISPRAAASHMSRTSSNPWVPP